MAMTPSEWSMLRRMTRTFSGAATMAAGGSPTMAYEVEAVSQAVVTAAATVHSRREAARRAGAQSASGDADGTGDGAGSEDSSATRSASKRPKKVQDPAYWASSRDDLLPPGGVIE
jgi:hypothetical protein